MTVQSTIHLNKVEAFVLSENEPSVRMESQHYTLRAAASKQAFIIFICPPVVACYTRTECIVCSSVTTVVSICILATNIS